MAKVVQIHINELDWAVLRDMETSLCYALKVNDHYTVCQAILEYEASTRISWLPNYKLFGTNFFTPGATVAVETNAVEIGFGQSAVLDAAGVLKPAETVGAAGAITFLNKYGPIHPGLIGTSAGPDGVQRQVPIYVERDAAQAGSLSLKPVNVVRIWFQENMPTDTMLSKDDTGSPPGIILTNISTAIDVDLTHADTATLQYKNSDWSTIAPT